MRRPPRSAVLFAVATLGLAALYASHVLRQYGGPTIDDAGITYAYADNLGHGRGLRLTAGEAPVEGFSNFLEVLLLAPAALLGADLDRAAKGLNVLAATLALAGLCLLVYRRARPRWRPVAVVPLLLPYCWPGFNYWISAGLEGGLLCALQIATVLSLCSGRDGALGVSAGLLAWTRPEGIVYGALAVVPPALARRWRAILILAAFAAALLATRLALFGGVLPNTYWAKVPVHVDRYWGAVYLQRFLAARGFYFWSALPVLAFLSPATRRPAAVALAQLAFACYFPYQVGGDWMREFRFMQPVMGPLSALCALGLVALASGTLPAPLHRPARQLAALAVALLPPLVVALSLWSSHAAQAISAGRDVDLKTLSTIAARYREIGRLAGLPGRPLVAEVDVGGLAYRGGLEVLDLTGLTDRVTALAVSRRPAVLPDYLFGERQPDLFHLHASWFVATPIHALYTAYRDYRTLAPAALDHFGFKGMTAVRAELLDPQCAPVQRARVPGPGGTLVMGVSAVASGDRVVLVTHARQTTPGSRPPPLLWVAPDGTTTAAVWHAGIALDPVPVGGALVALASVPAASLPLTLQGTALRLEAWPLAVGPPHTLEDLSRQPLLGLVGAPRPACDPAPFLDLAASAPSRARGIGFVARLCRGLVPELRARFTAEVVAAARGASDPDDRYEAAAAAPPIGLPQTVALRSSIEAARAGHQPLDESLAFLAQDQLAASPPRPAAALRLLLAARQYDAVILRALADGDEEQRPALCQALRALGLRSDRLAAPCPRATVTLPALLRQSFESADGAVTTEGAAGRWIREAAAPGQDRLGGGHGRRFVDTFGGEGTLLWGPLHPPGRTFAALVAGNRDDRLAVAVDVRRDGVWAEAAVLPPPLYPTVMRPERVVLPPGSDEVRVRIVDRSATGTLLVDALTFVGD
jgi:arabinofuranosyltransferase